MIVSIHIPKTAGTTLGALFDSSTGKRVMFDYDDNYRDVAKPQQMIRAHAEFISWFFQVLHGHFYYTKYASVFPDAQFVTCLRHPVDRVVSQYYHVGMLPDGQSDWRTPEIRAGKMNVVEFAKSDANISKAMSVHLDGRDIEHYDHVFFTEALERSCRLFETRTGFRFTSVPRQLNTREGRQRQHGDERFAKIVAPSDADRVAVFNLCGADVDLYQRAKSRFLTNPR